MTNLNVTVMCNCVYNSCHVQLCIELIQGGCEAQVECPISEGAGKLVRLLNMINNLVCWKNKEGICCCSEPAGETAEGFEAGGVCRCHGQCHQQVWLNFVL